MLFRLGLLPFFFGADARFNRFGFGVDSVEALLPLFGGQLGPIDIILLPLFGIGAVDEVAGATGKAAHTRR